MDITMPSLGADMDEGTLTQWLVEAGDKVYKGDIIAVIETSKGAIDMEVYETGVITQLCLEPMLTVPVGTVMATMSVAAGTGVSVNPSEGLDDSDDTVTSKTDSSSITERLTDVSDSSIQSVEKIQDDPPEFVDERSSEIRIQASPAARSYAQNQHIELSDVTGSGPQGAVLLKDLHRIKAKEETEETPKSLGFRKEETGSGSDVMRKSIAAAMEKSNREIPHYYLSMDIDVSEAQKYVEAINSQREPEHRTLLLALLLRAVAISLDNFPQFNGYYQGQKFEPQQAIHIGNAITLRTGGVLVPAIHNVDKLSLDDTMYALRDLVQRTRAGHVRSSELTDATITVTNIGDRGADAVFGVIYPPQVAILGIGRVLQKPLVIAGGITIRQVVTVTLSADHRVSDGTSGAKLLNAIDKQLQNPGLL